MLNNNVFSKLYQDIDTSNGRTGPLNKSASMPKINSTIPSIPQNPLPVWVRNPGHYYDISFYPHYTPQLPLGQYPMSPEMMKMQVLDAKVRNLEQLKYQGNEQMQKMIQNNNYLNSMSSMLPYIRGSEPYIQREQRRDEIRDEVNRARGKVRSLWGQTKHSSSEEEDLEEEERRTKRRKKRRKRQHSAHHEEEEGNDLVQMQTANEQPVQKQEVEVVPKEIARELQEENHKVRDNMLLMKNVIADMKIYLDNRIEILDMKQKISMETMRSVLENTGSKKIIASVRKVMDNEPIDPNDIDEDLHPMVQALPLIMDKKIQENEERRAYEKEMLKREKEEKRRREEQDRRWKIEDEKRLMEEMERKRREEGERLRTIEENERISRENNEKYRKLEEDLYKKHEEESRLRRREEELARKYDEDKKKLEEERAKFEDEKKRLEIDQKRQSEISKYLPPVLNNEYFDIDYIQKSRKDLGIKTNPSQIDDPSLDKVNESKPNEKLDASLNDSTKLPLKSKKTKIIEEPVVENITKEDNSEGLALKSKKKRKLTLKGTLKNEEDESEKTKQSDSTGVTEKKKRKKKLGKKASMAEEEKEIELIPEEEIGEDNEDNQIEAKPKKKKKKKRTDNNDDVPEENPNDLEEEAEIEPFKKKKKKAKNAAPSQEEVIIDEEEDVQPIEDKKKKNKTRQKKVKKPSSQTEELPLNPDEEQEAIEEPNSKPKKAKRKKKVQQ